MLLCRLPRPSVLITCRISTTNIPSAMSVTTDKVPKLSTHKISIIDNRNNDRKIDFAVCVMTPLFGVRNEDQHNIIN